MIRYCQRVSMLAGSSVITHNRVLCFLSSFLFFVIFKGNNYIGIWKGFSVVSSDLQGSFSPLPYYFSSSFFDTLTHSLDLKRESVCRESGPIVIVRRRRRKTPLYNNNQLMSPPKNENCRSSVADSVAGISVMSGESASAAVDWMSETINGGSLRHVDLHEGTNGWASPPGDAFYLRSKNYFTKRQKVPAGDYLLSPAGMDWLKSSGKLENVLARPDNRVAQALRKAQAEGRSLKSFIFAVNLQVPGKDYHHAVFYFATDDPVPAGSLLYRFINGDDAFRDQRFKLVNRIVKGPWIVKKTVGNYSACLLGKALTCNYHRGPNYLEIDIDIGSSAIANAILHLALGYVTSVTIDMGFLVEAQTEDELPERLIGAVRVCQMEMSSAMVVDAPPSASPLARGSIGLSKVNHHKSGDEEGVNA